MKGNHIVLVGNRQEAEKQLADIGADDFGVKWMASKAVFRLIKLRDIPCRLANIIKQEMLSQGGEAAVKRDTVSGRGSTDVLLMGTLKHYRQLRAKLDLQPLGLKQIAREMGDLLHFWEEAQAPGTVPMAHGQQLAVGERTLIMGILNVTPDSFSDGGRWLAPEAALNRALEMVEEGVDILDIGGMSTRPGHDLVSVEEELNRVVPIVEKLADMVTVPISVDTYRAEVARVCLEAGAHIINDIGGLAFDPDLAGVVAAHQAALIITHNRPDGEESYGNIIDDMMSELGRSVELAEQAGISTRQIIIDPGIGFGKNAAENLVVMKRLAEFKSFGRPILLGASRKRFIGAVLDLPVDDRLEGSLAAVVVGVMNGAAIVRVHDVRESKRVAMIADAVLRSEGS
ncbi:MAG: dihydropteroate synthase [Syntrophomonadaceae bacterium]|jgi:dihydropteroate synthase|nr:dihydropteroate synthase [Syntrophomonadaceae bacterium]